ncbi:DUF4190 domain-containing protein [Streptomyces sp. NPDC057757]|uniref:DUF4190 domain-containing protein n=1 Tax=Streptomyces sp. NPDC057757 TaxID=3346241 RepID=UPI0036B0BCA9
MSRVPLDKPAAAPRPEPDPWAAPAATAPSPANGFSGAPAHDQRTATPVPPGTGAANPSTWGNPFAPPADRIPYQQPPAGHTPYPQPNAGHTPYPQPPVHGQPVPPPPFAPGGPGQQPPYGYGYPGYPPQQPFHPGAHGYGGWSLMPPAPSNGMGTAALILGIASAVAFCVWPLTIVMGILGIVFGAIGRRKASRGEATNPGQALAGIICGAVGIVLGIALVVLIVVFADDSESGTDSGTDGDGFSTSLVVEQLR